MNSVPGATSFSFARNLLATAWPPSEVGDSALRHRLKVAVRGGQLAMITLVSAAVVATFAPFAEQASGTRIIGLLLAGTVFIAWSVHGLRDTVRALLASEYHAETKSTPAAWRRWAYFGVQFGLAELMYLLGDRGRVTAVMWLVLLPPVAHSVILLRRPGILLVCGAAIALFVANMVRWYGWNLVQNATLAFSFSVLFTVVFTLLAVTAEQSREQVQRLASELTEANRKLREYAVQVEELSATRERNRLAREIHDSLGHYLTVVNVQIEAARVVQDHDLVKAREALKVAQGFAQQGLQEVRRSVAALRALPLENKTLSEALKTLVEESSASGLPASMEVRGKERPLSPQAQLTLYRAAQEGLTNARRHSQATAVRLMLDFSTAHNVVLGIKDNGIGAAETGSGFGLLGLRERVALLSGAIAIRTAPGAGFCLSIELAA